MWVQVELLLPNQHGYHYHPHASSSYRPKDSVTYHHAELITMQSLSPKDSASYYYVSYYDGSPEPKR